MKRDVLLIPHQRMRNAPPLSFWIDDETGDVGGRDAAEVRAQFDEARRAGFVAIDPPPNSHPITDPYRVRADMAAILARGYILPSWLADALPFGVADDPDAPPGAVY